MPIRGVGEGAGEDKKGLRAVIHIWHMRRRGGRRQGWAGRALDCSAALRMSWAGAVFDSKSPGWGVPCLAGMGLHFSPAVHGRCWGGFGGNMVVDPEGQQLEPPANFAPYTGRAEEHVSMATKTRNQRLLGSLESFSLHVSFSFFCVLFFPLSPDWLLLLFHDTHKAENTLQFPGFHWMGPTRQKVTASPSVSQFPIPLEERLIGHAWVMSVPRPISRVQRRQYHINHYKDGEGVVSRNVGIEVETSTKHTTQ